MTGRQKPQRDAVARVERLSPELHFLSAILRQALVDAQSVRDPIRMDARRFWQTPENVEFWDSALALGGQLHAYVQRFLRDTHTPEVTDG